MSVITAPPKYEAQASSNAPVIVTFASNAASTPIFTISKSLSFLPIAVVVARATAFAATLLLLSPRAMGMFDLVFTWAPKFFSKLKCCRTLETVFSIKRVFSFGSEVMSALIMPDSLVNFTSALVHKSTPKAAPLPKAIALMIVAAP